MKFFKVLKALFYDHSFLTIFRLNVHKVSDELYRSAQPNPYQLKNLIKKYNLKTVVNLRGSKDLAILELERDVCKEMGVDLVEVEYHSRDIPELWRIEKAKEIFDSISYPALIHCKSGSDRTGLLSTLYLYFRKKIEIKDGIHQLNFIPYGHFNYGETGRLDFYFQSFLEYQKNHPDTDLISWHKTIDRRKMKEVDYKSNSFIKFIEDNVLRRE
jgi:protein tyrosine phosphatase (PTP) superfamily phosphohydrolase (DUF442 family)